jgi:hypothetical protein
MSHARRQIREKVLAVLGNLPTTSARVFTGTPWKLQPAQIPGLVVAVATDVRNDEFSAMGRRDGRTLQISIIAYAKGEDADDQCDEIALEVERAIALNADLDGALVKEMLLQSTEFSIADADQRIGMITLTYSASYRIVRSAPDTIIA